MNILADTKLGTTRFGQPIAEQIWQEKYRYVSNGKVIDQTVEDTWRRVAFGLAQAEVPGTRAHQERVFYDALDDFKLLPGGRILSGCGTPRNVTLFNTFVMRTIPDSVDGIMDTMKDAARTMQMGGGIGFDFSTIRPSGEVVQGLDCSAAGPLAAMDIADAVCAMVVTGMGRGAMMATLACDHPDIEAFIAAKANRRRFRNFNVSVLVTDRFMDAVHEDAAWSLVWQGRVARKVSARDLWRKIMQQTYDAAEPGVLFIDRINTANPLRYLEDVAATNSCAEQPLPPNGACPLASINLARLVSDPFGPDAALDVEQLEHLVGVAVRLLDNVIDISRFAVEQQRWEALNKRRIGIGVTGVGDALIMIGARYGSKKAVAYLEDWMRRVRNAAYKASSRLAMERGAFPLYHAAEHQNQEAIRSLDPDVRQTIAAFGLRNGVLTTLAPTGTTSMLAGNVSSGIEPVFATSYRRLVTRPDGRRTEELVQDYAAWLYHRMFGADAPLPACFLTVSDLVPSDHIAMQAAAQRWIDSGISKTVNCPEDISFAAFENIYLEAFASGCKGCTTYRPNAITGSVLTA